MPAGIERATSSVGEQARRRAAPPGARTRARRRRRAIRRRRRDAAAAGRRARRARDRRRWRQAGGHRVLSLRRAARPRWTRTRAAPGVVPSSRRDLVVVQLVDHAQRARRPGASSSSRLVQPRLLRGDATGVDQHAEPLAGARLERAAADRDQQHVAGDPEQPRAGRAVALVAEPRPGEPDLRERLGGQLVRGVLVAAAALVVAEYALRVAVIELAERARVGPGGGEQGGVASHGPR